MRPKVTWRSRPGPEGGFGVALPAIRAKHGDAIADAVEHCATLVAERRNWPSAQDVKHTLRAIVDRPAATDLQRLDGFTFAHIEKHSLRRFRVQRIRDLTAEQLRECAEAALAAFDWRTGRMPTDDAAAAMVAEILRVTAARSRAEQDAAITECLLACGLAAGSRTVERLREMLRLAAMVAEILRLAAARSRAEQDAAITEALLARGLAAGSRQIERLRKLAGGAPFLR